ncbi:MAG TPA: hypothetical protein VKG43_01515 [Acidimicrobiales bacterium]|nr:hypothetical protein [Acidimicrobiales bacterium]
MTTVVRRPGPLAPGLRRRLDPPTRLAADDERRAVAGVVGRASAEGRFGSSGRAEELAADAQGARRCADLVAVLDALDALVPGSARDQIREAVNRAHRRGQLELDAVLERTDRLWGALTWDEAEQLVGDLGIEIGGPPDPDARRGGVGRTVVTPAAVGGAVGAALVALPVVVTFPSDFGAWLPVVLFTGAFTSAGCALVALGLRAARPRALRRPAPWPGLPGPGPG